MPERYSRTINHVTVIPRTIILLAALAPLVAPAQSLPRSATPRGVVVAFLTETCSTDTSIDRERFRERFTGELGSVDPLRYRATVPNGARVRIDSIPDVPGGEVRRAVAFVTVTARDESENSYLFLRRDSIWRIEAIRRLVPLAQRATLRSAIAALDTSVPSFRLRRADIEHLLMSDDSLVAQLRRSLPAADKVAEKLAGAARWSRFALQDVDLAKVDEYRELDDDVPVGQIVFYQIDRGALERLKGSLGIRRIDFDRRFPRLIFLEAAALERSHYGYLHSPEAAALPPLSPSEFVLLRPAADGWWLYKRIGPAASEN
jgi:hypothetical protein